MRCVRQHCCCRRHGLRHRCARLCLRAHHILALAATLPQVMMRARPELRSQPLGITQKYLVVTCNYPARARGVGKLQSIKDALDACPNLVLLPGEDLTPFRLASDEIFREARAYCKGLLRGLAAVAAVAGSSSTGKAKKGKRKRARSTRRDGDDDHDDHDGQGDDVGMDDGEDDNGEDNDDDYDNDDGSDDDDDDGNDGESNDGSDDDSDDDHNDVSTTRRGGSDGQAPSMRFGTMHHRLPPRLAAHVADVCRATSKTQRGSGGGRTGGSSSSSSDDSHRSGMPLERNGFDELFLDCSAFCHCVAAVRHHLLTRDREQGTPPYAGGSTAGGAEQQRERVTAAAAAPDAAATAGAGAAAAAARALVDELLASRPLAWQGHVVMASTNAATGARVAGPVAADSLKVASGDRAGAGAADAADADAGDADAGDAGDAGRAGGSGRQDLLVAIPPAAQAVDGAVRVVERSASLEEQLFAVAAAVCAGLRQHIRVRSAARLFLVLPE